MSRYYIVHHTMDSSYGGWLKKSCLDDTFCMRPSNDTILGSKVGLDTLGVVDLDTFIVPDVFGLRAFDRQEPVVRVLRGRFSEQGLSAGARCNCDAGGISRHYD